MSGRHSRDKGKRGERELSKFIEEHLSEVKCRRGLQSRGARGEIPDVEVWKSGHRLPVWVEAKRSKHPRIEAAYRQAVEDSEGTGDTPIACTRKDHGEWLVTMKLEHFLQILDEALKIAGMLRGAK